MTVQSTTAPGRRARYIALGAAISSVRSVAAAFLVGMPRVDAAQRRAVLSRPWARHQAVGGALVGVFVGVFGWVFDVPPVVLVAAPLAFALALAANILARHPQPGESRTARVAADVLAGVVTVAVPVVMVALVVALLLHRYLGGGPA